MNPKMIAPITQALVELAKMGVQIFITTHDYFVQQSFNLLASYPQVNESKLDINFVSLYEDESNNKKILHESAGTLSELSHNSVMEEFDALYDREQRIINGST
jgi:predicted ATPase